MTAKPNLFDYATSELSQDAFLCWLLSWADRKFADVDRAMHEAAVGFVRSIFDKCGIPNLEYNPHLVLEDVRKQHNSIDVLALIAHGKHKYALVIEDKTGTTMHGDQLDRYRKAVEDEYKRHTPLFVYLKTGEISKAIKAEEAGYVVYSRQDLLRTLEAKKNGIQNQIFRDFYERLREKHRRYEAFRIKNVDEWVKERAAWEGFFGSLQKKMKQQNPNWGYANNPAGGEYVFYWGGKKIVDGNVYMEIHKKWDESHEHNGRYFLAFKVSGILQRKNRSEIRWNLYKSLMKSARLLGWGDAVNKPKRFGYGETMVFCETVDQNRWLVESSDGKLNMSKTIERLLQANDVLCNAADQYEQQQNGEIA